jgi:hypothetical protein
MDITSNNKRLFPIYIIKLNPLVAVIQGVSLVRECPNQLKFGVKRPQLKHKVGTNKG